MTTGLDIVCISLPTWEGTYMKSTVQLMQKLALDNRVLFVDYPFSAKDMVKSFLGGQKVPVARILGLKPRLRSLPVEKNSSIHVLTPPVVFPINGLRDGYIYDLLLKFNARRVGKAVRSAMNRLNMKEPVVINAFNPFIGDPLINKLGEALNLYYCYDEIGAAPWNAKHGSRLEKSFMRKVDAVITTSVGLYDSKRRQSRACYLVKNGVDFGHFLKAFEPVSLAREVRPVDGPVVGYMGSLDDRLDYELLREVCLLGEDMKFAFVGRIESPKAAEYLGSLDNVTLTGAKPPSELPEIMKWFDVGLIPFVKNEFTRNIYPLKINEYLAAGKPVVMTSFASLPEFESIASFADTPVEFLRAIRREHSADSDSRQMVRIRMARENSWDNRAEELSEIIQTLLARKAAA